MCGNLRAKILSYDAVHRTARVHIYGKTDGASNGLEATFAYPVGDNDLDTEREILADTEVYVFFEAGDEARPVIWAFSSHGEGAAVDVRRIRQENIEVLARQNVLIQAPVVHVKGDLIIDGNIIHTGDQTTTGKITATDDVIAGDVSLKKHPHSSVRRGTEQSDPPVPIGT